MKKQVSAVHKCHNHGQQANIWHREDETQKQTSIKVKQSALSSSEPDRTLKTTSQNKDSAQNIHTQSNSKQRSPGRACVWVGVGVFFFFWGGGGWGCLNILNWPNLRPKFYCLTKIVVWPTVV